MNPDAILEKVKDVIVEQLGVEDDTIKLDTSFSELIWALHKAKSVLFSFLFSISTIILNLPISLWKN